MKNSCENFEKLKNIKQIKYRNFLAIDFLVQDFISRNFLVQNFQNYSARGFFQSIRS